MADFGTPNPDRNEDQIATDNVEPLAIELRQRWDNGERVLVEELTRFDKVKKHDEALLDLIYHEVLVREEHGESSSASAFIVRFPQQADALRRLFDVHAAMKGDSNVDELPNAETLPGCNPPPSSIDGTDSASTMPLDTWTSSPERSFSALPLASAPPGYELLEEVGRGGMAIVYRARQKKLNRVVALKMLLAGARATPELLARFEQEARTVAQLQHSSIVQIHEIGEHDRLPFLALEFLEGGTLKEWLAGRPLPPKEAAETARNLARTMEYAHEQGVVHRDLKPANVLLVWRPPDLNSPTTIRMAAGAVAPQRKMPQLQTKIGDFGLAHLTADGNDLTATGQILGTPSYMAPEQAAALADPDFAQDVYSVGAILYELLTGRPPFQGPTVLDTLDQVRNDEPVPPRRLQPGIPRDLETICLKCLLKSPARRYAGMKVLADDLQRFLDDRPIAARRVTATELAFRWLRRRPTIAALTASLIAISFIALNAIVREARRANEGESNLVIQRDEAERMHKLAIEERDAAKANLRQAIEAVESLAEVAEQLQLMPNQQLASQEILNNTVAFYEDIVPKDDDPESTQLLATSLIRAAEVGSRLGNLEVAERQARQAIDILQTESRGLSELRPTLSLAYAYWTLGTILRSWQRQAESLTAFQSCRTVLDAIDTNSDDSTATTVVVLRAKADIGVAAIFLSQENETEAIKRFATASQRLRSLAEKADSLSVRYDFAHCLSHFGSALRNASDDRAAGVLQEALLECESLVSDDNTNPQYRSSLTYALYAVAVDARHSGRHDQALEHLQRADAVLQVLVEDFPSVYEYRFRYAAVLTQQTSLLLENSQTDNLKESWMRLCLHLDESRDRFPKALAFARWSARWQYWFGDYLHGLGDTDLADHHWRRAIEAGESLLQNPLLTNAERLRSTNTQSRHLALLPTATREEKQEALKLARSMMPTNENEAVDNDVLATLGIALYATGDSVAAVASLETVRASPRGLGRLEFWQLTMAYWQSGQKTKARHTAKTIPKNTKLPNPSQFQIRRASRRCLQMLNQKKTPSTEPSAFPVNTNR